MLSIRRIDRANEAEVALVAERMRLTLIEVLGHEVGANLYDLPWLRARVRWHLDPEQCTGEVFVVEHDGHVVGHTIVRLEEDEGRPIGLFTTTYVVPDCRRLGLADTLVVRGEAWLRGHGMDTLVTDTSAANERLITLFEARGYRIVLRDAKSGMVRLSKSLL